jgi:hypothetical protein
MSQDDIRHLMGAASAGGRDSVHKCLDVILAGVKRSDRRATLAQLNAELLSESVEIFQFSDRGLVASVLRQKRDAGK